MTIRRTPADFVVREILTEEFLSRLRERPEGPRRHAVYELTKTSLTTEQAIRGFAAAMGARHGRVDYAGLKDKHAVASQHVSVAVGGPKVAAGTISGPGWSAVLRGWSNVGVSAGVIDRNRFTIVVRDLSGQASREMERRARLLRKACAGAGDEKGGVLIVNYFGDQRFGSARHGGGLAAGHLVRGDFERALRLLIGTPARKDTGKKRQFTRMLAGGWGRWEELSRTLPPCPERRAIERLAAGGGFREAFAALPNFLQTMCVEAYQSHLWNEVARRLVVRMRDEGGAGAGGGDAGLIRADDDFGEMLFLPAAAVHERWAAVRVPMLAPETVPAQPWRQEALDALAAEGLTLDQLRIPGLRRPAFGHAMRPLLIVAERFEIGAPEPDELARAKGRLRRTIGFDLPRGAYATVVLRALGE